MSTPITRISYTYSAGQYKCIFNMEEQHAEFLSDSEEVRFNALMHFRKAF